MILTTPPTKHFTEKKSRKYLTRSQTQQSRMEMIKPTQEKKKKKVTSKRAQEIIRRRSSVLTLTATSRRKSLAVSGENQEGFEPAGSRR